MLCSAIISCVYLAFDLPVLPLEMIFLVELVLPKERKGSPMSAIIFRTAMK